MTDAPPTALATEGSPSVDRGPELPRLALRPKDAARALGIGTRLLWSLTNRGEIPHIKLGKAVLYPISELERWLAQQAKGGGR